MQEKNDELRQDVYQAEGIKLFKNPGKCEYLKERDVCDLPFAVGRIKKELEAILDAITDPIFIHDKDLKIIRANKAYCEAGARQKYW